MHRILLVSAGCLALSSQAVAEIDKVRVELSPFVGVLRVDEKLLFESQFAPFVGARFGVAVAPRVAFEARGGWARFEDRRSGVLRNADLGLASAGLSIDLTSDTRVRPFVTFGGGFVEDLSTDAASSVSHPFGEIGGGLKIVGASGFGIRLEAHQVMMSRAGTSGREFLQNTAFGGRLVLPLSRKFADLDSDGVRDNRDLCSATPTGARVDAEGCPTDSDEDGVWDGIDVCMSTPTGAVVDATGCPSDADQDGVWDGIDVCMSTPAGATVDDRGCPTDMDADGVLDGHDECPDTPAGKRVDAKGCQVSALEHEMLDTGRLRLQGVHFLTGKAELSPGSTVVLDQAGALLANWPQLQVEVGGHTDSRGAAEKNRVLSERRAQAVGDYLLARYPKISSNQVRIKGYGEEHPIAGNQTSEGRAKNRRVEIRVLNREELRKTR